ncbi:MAG: hypothetical protein E7040_09010 [Lentisphaerae bacterium]|nr:hypothetical protein [Lentisphaerota bacterium]
MRVLFAVLSFVCMIFWEVSAQENRILQGDVQLYTAPTAEAGSLTTVKEGTAIFFVPLDRGWIQVDFSAEMEAWVAECFLHDGKYAENTIFRTDSSSAADSIVLKESFAGQNAEILGSDKSGYWKKVRLKGKFAGYIQQRDFEESLKKKNVTFRIKRMPMVNTAIGRLLPLEKKEGQATHKLVYKVNEAEYLVAYVIPDKVNLKLWENWVIYLSGESIWLPSVNVPFLRGGNIFPAYR